MCIAVICGGCTQSFDPETAIRIAYESPMGCDEISGTVILKASVKGDGAPVAAAMRYELRMADNDDPLVIMGYPPSYEVSFDTTTIRDGFVSYRAVPIDGAGNEINIQSLHYNPYGIVPKFRGLMINNGELDLSRPLIVFGAETEPYSGELTGTWTVEQIIPHLIFATNLMEHLREVGNIPEMCFSDETTLVMDPSQPLAKGSVASDGLVDMMGEPVTGVPRWNKGTICLQTPFFEIKEPNGIPDIWENTAFDNVRSYTQYGSVKTEPVAFAFYDEIGQIIADTYNATLEHQSYFGFRKPIRNAEPENLLKKRLRSAISAGATCVLIYDFYLKTNDFEMSVGSWPYYQKTVDELNRELGTSVRIGAITTNQMQLMHYDNFLRSLFLGIRDTIQTSQLPSEKKIGIIFVEHGSSMSGRMYDVLRLSTKQLNEHLTGYFTQCMSALYDGNAAFTISYIEGSYAPADGVQRLGKQIENWINEGYEYIVIYPVDWFWESRQTYQDMRQFAIEEIDIDNPDVFVRDTRDRTEVQLGNTRLIISETTLSKKSTCPAAVHYLKTAAAQLLEDRMIMMTGKAIPKSLTGTVSVSGSDITLSLPFSDKLVAHKDGILLHSAGIRGQGTVASEGIHCTLDTSDTANFMYALLAENGIGVESVAVSEALIDLAESEGTFQGNIAARASAQIARKKIELILSISVSR
ncbi:MAG: hypothetical protein N3B18_13625 [Desulfobacterota bacterium]|nr:hypothetical protein [Thermodesulfobacteriota bacterium]